MLLERLSSSKYMENCENGRFTSYDINWFKEHFHDLIDLCNAIELVNIEELELTQKIKISKREFNLKSNKLVNLKMTRRKNIEIK